MAQEKIGIDFVFCPSSNCGMIFTRSELEPLGDLLVIPEHRDPLTEAICSGSFKIPNEIPNTRVSNFFRKS